MRDFAVLLFAALLAAFAAAAAALWLQPKLAEAERQHRAKRDRVLLMDRFRLRGVVALLEPHLRGAWSKRLDDQLYAAGNPWSGTSGSEYLTLGVIGVSGSFLTGLFLGFLLKGVGLGVVFGLVIALPMTAIWYVGLSSIIKRRKETTWREFPFFLDTLVMTMEGGATLAQAIEIYVRSNPQSLFAADLSNAVNRSQAGADIIKALEETNDRITVSEIKQTMQNILTAEIEGADRLHLMRENADDMRARRWEESEKMTEILRTKIVLPTMLIFLSVMLLILAPAFVEVSNSGMF
jgi:tight adherence protein C